MTKSNCRITYSPSILSQPITTSSAGSRQFDQVGQLGDLNFIIPIMSTLSLDNYGVVELDSFLVLEVNGGTGPGIPDGHGGYKKHPNHGSQTFSETTVGQFLIGLFFGCDC